MQRPFRIRILGMAVAVMLCGQALARVPPPAGTLLQSAVPVSKTVPATRGTAPLHSVGGVAPGQAGYVHYFLLRMPDDSVEVQVGIELEDQRIAWSFPELGVVVSPFISGETIEVGGNSYDVWHLYGLRPFPGNAAMARLRKALPARVDAWVRAGIPYCLDDSPRGKCMSCIGLVLRALFPSSRGYPDMPRDFWRASPGNRYTPNDLLLYLAGMLDLPDRNARLQRLSRLALPADLRDDLESLIHAIGTGESKPAVATGKRAGAARGRL
ncbi:MAG: hypothetical protein KF834_02035 [Burkholderiales bacterium]|nr:hypothetical protein [Burkholderiales bacterium]